MSRWVYRYLGKLCEKRLRETGLRFEDLFIDTPISTEAVAKLSREEYILRERRIFRAVDMQVKGIDKLPAEVQAVQEPWKPYLSPTISKVRASLLEKHFYN